MKCRHCGKRHNNKSQESGYKKIGDICQNCNSTEQILLNYVIAINGRNPRNGNRRIIYDLSYKIKEEK